MCLFVVNGVHVSVNDRVHCCVLHVLMGVHAFLHRCFMYSRLDTMGNTTPPGCEEDEHSVQLTQVQLAVPF